MKSLSLAILMGVILSLAATAQAGGKDIVVPSGHPAADPKSYDKYEDALDRIEAYKAANLMPYDKYEDVLDRIEAYLAELQKLRSGIAQKDNR